MKKLVFAVMLLLITWTIGHCMVTVYDFVEECNQIEDYTISVTENIQDI